MKKIIGLLCLSAVLLLSACGSGTNEGTASNQAASASGKSTEKSNDPASEPATVNTVGKIYNQSFNEPFFYHRTNSVTNETSKVAITLSKPEIVKTRTMDENLEGEIDYVKVFVQVENVGEGNSTDMAVRFSSFKVYNANGKEMTEIYATMKYLEDEFEPVELRPGGKNEGYMYIPFTEGEEPAEIIYFDSTIKGSSTNQYVFKL